MINGVNNEEKLALQSLSLQAIDSGQWEAMLQKELEQAQLDLEADKNTELELDAVDVSNASLNDVEAVEMEIARIQQYSQTSMEEAASINANTKLGAELRLDEQTESSFLAVFSSLATGYFANSMQQIHPEKKNSFQFKPMERELGYMFASQDAQIITDRKLNSNITFMSRNIDMQALSLNTNHTKLTSAHKASVTVSSTARLSSHSNSKWQEKNITVIEDDETTKVYIRDYRLSNRDVEQVARQLYSFFGQGPETKIIINGRQS